MSEQDMLVLEAQIAMSGLTFREFMSLTPELQERVRKTRLETNQEYTGPVKKTRKRRKQCPER